MIALATQWGISRSAIDRRSQKEDWKSELRRRAKAASDARIDAHQAGVTEAHREIRERHVLISQGLISQATRRYNALVDGDEEISIEQMLKFLAFAMPQEREALGLPKAIQITDVTPVDLDRAAETPSMRMARRAIEKKIDADLAKAYSGLFDAGE